MSSDFAAAMRHALDQVRAGKLKEATAAIRAGLAKHGDADAAGPPDQAHPSPPRTPGSRTNPRVDDMAPPKSPGRSLGDVVNALRRGRPTGLTGLRPTMGKGMDARRARVPEGADGEHRHFSCAAGSRRYQLHVPTDHPDDPKGLLVMLHGCTQNPDDFAFGTGMNEIAGKHGLLVAYPEQTPADNASACWNWFRPGDQDRDRGEPAIIAGLTLALISEFAIEPRQVFIAGFSAGGAMAAVMGETYPELFSAIGVHSGLPYRAATDMVSAFSAMRGDALPTSFDSGSPDRASPVRTIVFHGRTDRTVHPANGERLIKGGRVHLGEIERETSLSEQGRSYDRTVWRAPDGRANAELWLIDGAGHAWSGGRSGASYTDPAGPDASAAMISFFLHDA